MWSHTILECISSGLFIGESQFICTSCHTAIFLPRNPSHSAHHLNIVTLSFPCPLSCINFSLPLFPPPFFTSSTPAVFHLNISSSCLAASVACQVSSRSQGPTVKWSTEVIFRGVCVRKRETERERERGGMRRRSSLARVWDVGWW